MASYRSSFAVPLVLVLLGVGAGTAVFWHQHRAKPAADVSGKPSASGSAPGASAVGVAALRHQVGTRRAYSLVSTRIITLRAPREAKEAAGSEETLRYELHGTWETTVLQNDPLGVLLLTQLREPQLRGATDSDAALQAKVLADLAVPFFLQLDPSGRLRVVRLRKDVSAQARGFIKAVAAQLQYVRPAQPDRTWNTEESDPTGEYVAHYEQQATSDREPLRYHKSRQRYLHVATAQGLGPVTELGKVAGTLDLTYTLDGADAATAGLQKVTGKDSLQVEPGAAMPSISSSSEITLALLRTDGPVDVTALLALASTPDYEPVAIAALDSDSSTAHADDAQLVKGASLQALVHQLGALPESGSGPQRAALHTRLSALFRLDGSAAQKAMLAVKQGLAEPAAKTLIGALGGAGTAAAQAALVQLAETKSLTTDLRENALAVLGLAENPEDSTAAALLRATGDTDREVRSTAALALGNVAAGQRKSNPGDADQSVDELLALLASAATQDEQIVYLQALGNAGDARALPALQRALASEAAAVRSAAVVSLRFIEGAQVDQLITGAIIQDRAAEVRRGALFAASLRALPSLFAALQKAALGDEDVGVRMDAVGLLGKALTMPAISGSAGAVLRTVASKDPEPEVRRAALNRLQSGR